MSEDDLWFLPGPMEVEPDDLQPGPRADRAPLFDPRLWQAAQDRHSGELAELAALFGALDERLRSGPQGWRHSLALIEVADLGWWTGERIAMDQLALWVGLRLGAARDDTQALLRAGWAVRRLSGGAAPAEGGWTRGLAAFLGFGGPGKEVPDNILDMAGIMGSAEGLHPVTQGAMLFHGWIMLGQDKRGLDGIGQGAAVAIEAAVMAARHGAGAASGRALFLPLALNGPGALRATGTEERRLGAWIAGATRATQAALLHLDRLRDWAAHARAATADLTGRTPPALIDALVAWPMISASLAEELTKASRAAVQRNLDTLAARRLIREVTGQGRFRVWTVKH